MTGENRASRFVRAIGFVVDQSHRRSSLLDFVRWFFSTIKIICYCNYQETIGYSDRR